MDLNKRPQMYPKLDAPEKLKHELNWPSIIYYIHLAVMSILSLFVVMQTSIATHLFSLVLILFGILGSTAGAHRLWAHKSYTASKKLRFFLMICQTIAGHGSIYQWVLQHRIHHKYYGTTYDPYNHKSGFLYSHLFSFFEMAHVDEEKVKESIDMTDLEEDKFVMFQHKYYWVMFFILHILLPINAPAEYWGEPLAFSIIIVFGLRSFIVLNYVCLIHSGHEVWGLKPGERYPNDSNSVFFINKNYWIQYHYMVPWDYLTGEYGQYATDCTSKFIRICAAIGAAENLKTTGKDAIRGAAFKAATTKKPIHECMAEIEAEAVEKQYYLQPLKLIT